MGGMASAVGSGIKNAALDEGDYAKQQLFGIQPKGQFDNKMSYEAGGAPTAVKGMVGVAPGNEPPPEMARGVPTPSSSPYRTAMFRMFNGGR